MARLAFILAAMLAVSSIFLLCSADSEPILLQEGEGIDLPSAPSAGIISRDILFGEPERSNVLISPDGRWISYLMADGGVHNVQIAPLDNTSQPLLGARQATTETSNNVKGYVWAYTSRHIIYLLDSFGDENWHICVTDIATGETKDLTPYDQVSATIQARSSRYPQEILIGLNLRDPECYDLYRINITTEKMYPVLKNEKGFARFVVDNNLQVRMAAIVDLEGDVCYLIPDGSGSWKPFLDIGYQDSATTGPIGFDRAGKILYLSDSRMRNTAAVNYHPLKEVACDYVDVASRLAG